MPLLSSHISSIVNVVRGPDLCMVSVASICHLSTWTARVIMIHGHVTRWQLLVNIRCHSHDNSGWNIMGASFQYPEFSHCASNIQSWRSVLVPFSPLKYQHKMVNPVQCRQQYEMHLLDRKLLYFVSNMNAGWSKDTTSYNWLRLRAKCEGPVSGTGLVPNRRHAIVWINDDAVDHCFRMRAWASMC